MVSGLCEISTAPYPEVAVWQCQEGKIPSLQSHFPKARMKWFYFSKFRRNAIFGKKWAHGVQTAKKK